ncbi:MAG: hypothetical protein AVDCRST_MAG96-3526 [uncultured Segetibacter sp.]|uniref:Uncharacterized protein n=1 Tax=uncultured Segetibacter sp. TaxID=481133 RepID=A0A6J4TRM3_9BACT|nr:MAG: hypothetical protein AVDCRST_MAG96-3526 [uncultured Segetibacter sp.]
MNYSSFIAFLIKNKKTKFAEIIMWNSGILENENASLFYAVE